MDFGDTWTWDGANWTQQSQKTLPGARIYSAMAYDSVHDQVVLFGGFVGETFLNDTWLWDGSNWTQASPQTSPSGRDGTTMAYDSAHSQVVLFGGGIAHNPFQVPVGDTWTWSGSSLVASVAAVVNGASFVGGGVVPGEIATLFGNNLTSSTGINLTSGLPLPTEFFESFRNR